MFCKLDVRRKSIVTLALSKDNRKIVVRYFANRAPDYYIETTVRTARKVATPTDYIVRQKKGTTFYK